MAKQKGGKKNQAEFVEKEAAEKIAPIVERYGYDLWDIVFEKEGAMWYLKVLFDKPDGGIDDTECEEITAPINEAVDGLSCIDLIDVLEVGSPGLGRELRTPAHLVKMTGQPIKIMLRDENGKDIYISGTLTAYSEEKDTLTVDCTDGGKELLRSRCRRITLDL